MNTDILIGMQYGSEGKGFVSTFLAGRGLYDGYVRSGGPNAGHCMLHGGKEYKMRMIPCGWADPAASLFIGPATTISAEVLTEEITMLERDGYTVCDRIFVHPHATVIQQRHMDEELQTVRNAIGSTAEGVGACRRGKLSRVEGEYELVKDSDLLMSVLCIDTDPSVWYERLYSCENVLLEGTQGAGLCISHGQFPYTTSWPCTAAQMLSDAGLPISSVRHIIGVVRTMPIRVAGNSGPLRDETTFEELGLPEERTTVTRKVRRIAKSVDWEELDKNMGINKPSVIAITFGDYLSKAELDELVDTLETRYRAPVGYVGLGPDGRCLELSAPFTAVVEKDNREDSIEETLDLVLERVKTLLLAKRRSYGTDNINEMGEVGIFYRVWDKICRIKHQLVGTDKVIEDEDPWLDIVGYGLIVLVRRSIGRW